MSLTIRFARPARFEFDEAILWYEQQMAGLGSSFEQAVQESLDEIVATPLRYPLVFRDVRQAIVVGFPYCVHYCVRGDRLIVVAVFHHSRNPSDWQSRI